MRLSVRVFGRAAQMLEYYSHFNPSPLSMHQFIEFGKKSSERASFLFLRKELPVRLANIMAEIHLLPETLLAMPSVKHVQSWYIRSFQEVLDFDTLDPDRPGVLPKFCEALATIRNRHTDVVQTMAQGVVELKESHIVDTQTENSIQYFLDRFYMSRISIRMLINQHSLLFGKELNGNRRHIGSIDPSCNVLSVLKDAFENARFLCEQYYLGSPDVVVTEHNAVNPGRAIEVVYVPSHLYHILFELFKNAMRAVVEFHDPKSSAPYSPINVVIVKGKHDLTIKMSDLGGGFPLDNLELLFRYMYSTAPQPPMPESDGAPLAGYGYGLPLSRLYAKYFQGDLKISSYEGYGTDAVVYLKAVESEANEMLPVFNKASSRHYVRALQASDWSNSLTPSKPLGQVRAL
ncbi:unnamed protein product [Darwinula stevensoni]|uniref:Protein-serine/threonine kinase n=1 Tax=Darwinula stevensoni TaxID=69355 RepID=A0A7R9A392_9CRUS|nr:unnamed protein product [Darwinula stevensoni]CAG0891229.1 unnamed protein product [Darwinula stevensoni]